MPISDRETYHTIEFEPSYAHTHGLCPTAELHILLQCLKESQQWTQISVAGEVGWALKIQDLPSYVIHVQGETWVCVDTEPGNLSGRPCSFDGIERTLKTAQSIASNPYYDPSPELIEFVSIVHSTLAQYGVMETQEDMERVLVASLFGE